MSIPINGARLAITGLALAFVAVLVLMTPGHPSKTVSAATQPTFAIDLNVANGGGPCNIVDSTATVFAGAGNKVAAICLIDGSTGTGGISGYAPKFTYPASVTASNGGNDDVTDLNANPNFNTEGLLGSTAITGTWDCNAFNGPASRVVASPLVAAGCNASPSATSSASPRMMMLLTYQTPAPAAAANLVWDGGATITYDGEATFRSCGGGDITCTDATITVAPAADLEVTKSVVTNPVIAGGTATYQIHVVNHGPQTAPNVTIIDDFHLTGKTFNQTLTDPQNPGVPSTLVPAGTLGNPDPIVLLGGGGAISLASGASIDVFITFDVPLGLAGKPETNLAFAMDFVPLATPPVPGVSDPDLTPLLLFFTGDPNQLVDTILACAQEATTATDVNGDGVLCNNASAASDITAPANMTLVKTGSPDPVNAGSNVTWTVTATSTGLSPASSIILTDTPDVNQTLISASVNVGNCTETGTSAAGIAGNTATCTSDLASLSSPNAIVMTVVASVDTSPANRTCSNAASVTFADPITVNATGSVQCFPPTVRMNKDVDTDANGGAVIVDASNLFICDNGPNCWDPNNPTVNNGNGHLVVLERLFNQNDPDGTGAFEFQVKFDHKLFDINVFHGIDLNGDGDCTDAGETQAQDTVDACYLYQTGRVADWNSGVGGCAVTIINENAIFFGCVSKNPQDVNGDPIITPGPQGPEDVVATLHISPEPDLKSRLTPGQKNGVAAIIDDENCEAADIWGDPLGTGTYDNLGREILLPGIVTGGLIADCSDLTVTERILEADLNTDCTVDLLDDQAIAFRYGSTFGSLFYNAWYDLEPALKDFDIDIKDLQKVFGRNGSTCADPLPNTQTPLPSTQAAPPPLP